MRTIAVASGKGGVGKTSVSLNLGLALASAGKKVVVIDADIVMANLAIMLGVERAPISIHNVLSGEVEMRDAVYEGPLGLHYVPAGLSMEKLRRVDYSRLRAAVGELKDFDYGIIDCPSGLGTDAEAAIKSAKESIIVTTPEPSSLADALKVKNFCERSNVNVLGIVYNMYYGDKAEVSSRDMATVIDSKVLVEIPIDANVRRASALQEPVFLKFPGAPFSQAMRVLAAHVTGERVQDAKIKKDWLAELMSYFSRLFRRGE